MLLRIGIAAELWDDGDISLGLAMMDAMVREEGMLLVG
jgi:hypothetical protein